MLVRSELDAVLPPRIEHTGWRLELSGDQFHGALEVFRLREPWDKGPASFFDYLVRGEDLTWGVTYRPSDGITSEAGTFLPLDCVLCALYRKHEVMRPLPSFLAELRDCLPLRSGLDKRRRDGAALAAPELREAGFEVTGFFVYGSSISVDLGWVFPQDRNQPDNPLCIHAASIGFRPTPARTLGRGKWSIPLDTTLMSLLGKQLRALLRGSPERWLSAKGVEATLSEFKWTKATLLTREQLVAARIEFVRQHPELHDQARELARALLKEGYWSDTTQLCVITKQVPGLIASAKS